MNKRAYILVVLFFLLAGCAGQEQGEVVPSKEPVTEDEATSLVIGGDEEALREFIDRFIKPAYNGSFYGERLVLIEKLPEDLPFDLPLPEDHRIIGSVIQGSVYGGPQIILDVGLSPEEVMEFYDAELTGDEWRVAPDPGLRGFRDGQYLGKSFCYNEDEAYLTINPVEMETGMTSLRVHIDMDSEGQYTPCNNSYFGGSGYEIWHGLIPDLVVPGIRIQESSTGGVGSGEEQHVTANFKTSLSAEEIISRYNEQLIEAGWEMVGENNLANFSFSQWQIVDGNDEEWSGLLVVIGQEHASDKYFAMVQIIKNAD